MLSLTEALNKTIKKVDGHQTNGKLKKCKKCGHWHSKDGQSEINHKRFCTGDN